MIKWEGSILTKLLKERAKKDGVKLSRARRNMGVACDISHASVYEWERGRVPNGALLCRMAEYLDVSIDTFFKEKEEVA